MKKNVIHEQIKFNISQLGLCLDVLLLYQICNIFYI